MEDREAQEVPSLKISVLIVSYNSESALRRSLEALAASDHPDTFEVLVVDCGSGDGSPGVDEDFPKTTVLRLPRNFGRTKARNIGVRTAKGEFLFLMEPGVEVEPGLIAALSERLQADSGVVGVAPLLVTGDGEPLSRCGDLPGPVALYQAWRTGTPWYEANPPAAAGDDDLLEVECPDPRALMVRTGAVRGMNYFDERYGEFGSDLELYTQAYRASRRFVLAPAVRATYKDEGAWQPAGAGEEEALKGDAATGLIAYLGKHYGWYKALKLRIRMILRALGHFEFGLLSQHLNDQKIDGSQRTL